MAHFAELNENNQVMRVVVLSNLDIIVDGQESEEKGKQILSEMFGGNWIQTSYNKNFRKNFAGPGMYYNQDLDAFIAEKPLNSWVLNQETFLWEAPIACPGDIKDYIWDENTLSWIEA